MSRRLFIHAANVHQGGGRSLLRSLLTSIPSDIELVLCLDARFTLPDDSLPSIHIEKVKPTIIKRVFNEKWLAVNVKAGDMVLCFGNLPPLFRLRGHVVVFVQNRYLVDDVELNGFGLKTRLRLMMERYWLSSKISNADEFIVQTPSMKTLLASRSKKTPIRVLPFVGINEGYVRNILPSKIKKSHRYTFVYVASGEHHKNHRQLIDSWCLLAKDGVFPALKLTLDKSGFSDLCCWIDQKAKENKLQVENVGKLSLEEVKNLYASADALIYPSTLESFGLPLIEARQARLPVLASELDYVRDILDPEQTFDPGSATSIARAVKRFMGIEEPALLLQDAKGFMQKILAHSR